MSFIERAAEAIESEPTSTDLEDVCRKEVAKAVRSQRRMLTAEEIEDIVDQVVEDETFVEAEDKVDGDELVMTDMEWDSVPSEDKVEFGDVEGMVVAGKFLPVRLVPDQRGARISNRIAASMDEQAVIASTVDGISPRSLYHPVPDVTMPCPHCASRNVTPVWYDAGEVVAMCNECATEFDASIDDVARATLAEKTVEDVDILPEAEVFGSVWVTEAGRFGYEVYAAGDLVDNGEEQSYEKIIERFDDIADAYDEIEEGTVIDMNGDSEVVVEIDGDKTTLGSGRNASRIRVARMVADKKAFLDNSNVFVGKFVPGTAFSAGARSIIVSSVDGDTVYTNVIGSTPDGRVSEQLVAFTASELHAKLESEGFLG